MKTPLTNLTVRLRGYENSAYVMNGHMVLAEVFTDSEPADQHDTARLFAAAPELFLELQKVHRTLRKQGHDMTSIDAALTKATGETA